MAEDQGARAKRSVKREGERRAPMAIAVVAVGVLHAFLPNDFRVLPRGVFTVFLLALLVALVIGDPGRIDKESSFNRIATDVLIGLITAANLGGVVRLVHGLLTNASFTGPSQLLQIGAILWAVNVIAFALWYWDLDAGGAAARMSGRSRVPRAFVFPEYGLPENADGTWFPQFVDYFTLSFYTATAFSPTDVSAVKRWAKLLMVTESAVSLLIAILVVARAVNIWPTPGGS